MNKSQKLQLEQSEKRQKINTLLGKDSLTDDERTELDGLTKRMGEIEVEFRAAVTAEAADLDAAKATAKETGNGLDKEARERLELRSKSRVTRFFEAAARGRVLDGPEAELQAAAGARGIPFELFEPQPETRASDRGDGTEHRAVAAVPGTVGVNLDPIRPAIFATSIAARLGIDMPRVMSGTYASATITTSQQASAQPKSGAAAGVAGAFAVETATPKRVSARLELTLEDIAAVGQANFESALRQNLALALSDELDNQAINGDGSGNDLTGLFARLTNPDNPSAVTDFDGFAAAHAGGVDGLWANTIKDVVIICGPASYVLASRTFQTAANYKGELSAAAYALANTGGLWTNKRMPDADGSNHQQAILYRKGPVGPGRKHGNDDLCVSTLGRGLD